MSFYRDLVQYSPVRVYECLVVQLPVQLFLDAKVQHHLVFNITAGFAVAALHNDRIVGGLAAAAGYRQIGEESLFQSSLQFHVSAFSRLK